MANPKSIQVKARKVVRELGWSEGEPAREYKDWHIEIRQGTSYVSVWNSSGMVFLSMAGTPVFYRSGAWEQYLERLFQRTTP
ncbi:MAG TPA: hypothetical protein DEV93_13410 [Chloroflexi bacterium]|jgi:hypothetical protein|nr:hypothetical protein [Chloroflexota bacterium]